MFVGLNKNNDYVLDIISCLAKYSYAIHWPWVVLINLSLIIGAFSLSQLDYVN